MEANESELESFRRKWREEVSNKSRALPRRLSAADLSRSLHYNGGSTSGIQIAAVTSKQQNVSHESSAAAQSKEDHQPYFFHDLDNSEDYYKLGNASTRHEAKPIEPRTALDHYERAVEKESVGNLGDSVNLYRRAEKLDPNVHEQYKQKHFPAGSSKAKTTTTSQSATHSSQVAQTPVAVESSLNDLIDELSRTRISVAEPETDLSPPPPCSIASLPEEILTGIFLSAALNDFTAFVRLALVCKRFAYLVMTEETIWKRLNLDSVFGVNAMHYRYTCDLKWKSLVEKYQTLGGTSIPLKIQDLTPTIYNTYRSQFRYRPRIRFNGCYISVVNYTRAGASHQNHWNWATSPVHIVTYYRYLRFFPDGTLISLLSTSEPADVVHHLTKENIARQQNDMLPSAVMNKGLKGRWRLSGPASSAFTPAEERLMDASRGPGEYSRELRLKDDADMADATSTETSLDEEIEDEGDVHIETQGVTPSYMWKMHFGFGHAGRKGIKNNKLSWKGFWSYNRQRDEWSPFGLKKDKAYYFSRVKSYGVNEH